MARGKPLSFDRNEVLEKAMEIFWEKGYVKTGMTELLDHMGIQRQSFYNTFGSKEEVFVEVVKLYSSSVLGRVKSILGQERHPLENMEQLFAMWQEMGEAKEGCGCMMGNSIAEFGLSQEAVGTLLKTQVEGLYEIFYQAFSKARDNGYLAENKDPKALATTFVTISQGMALLSKVGFGKEMLQDVMRVSEDLLKS